MASGNHENKSIIYFARYKAQKSYKNDKRKSRNEN